MKSLWLFLFAGLSLAYAQETPSEQLQEIILRGNFSPGVNSGYRIQTLVDSTLPSHYRPLGVLLQKEANLYFRQNGNAMVSSISLRGTTAAQTGVFWNGIAMNSALNGQTDFNSFNGSGFDRIEIRRGGGSALLGSGAVGGAINLSDDIDFDGRRSARLNLDSGSFGFLAGQFKGRWSSDRVFAKLSLGGSRSDNDYPFPGLDLKNEHGSFNNHYASGVFGMRFNPRHQLSLTTNYQFNDRDLPGTLTVRSRENLENKDYRALLDWKYTGDRLSSSVKTAFLSEQYLYLFDENAPENRAFGESDRLIGKVDLSYFVRKGLLFRGGVELEHSSGSGSSIEKAERDDLSGYLQLHHRPFKGLRYNLSSRAGYSSAYDIPLTFSFDLSYAIGPYWTVKGAVSNNYRLPTFNDLYWSPGGNENLDPERSSSAELGIDLSGAFVNFSLSSFLIKSKDLIQWQPTGGVIWSPVNIDKSTNYGLELTANGQADLGQARLDWRLFYDYTEARNEEDRKQLIYVPKHKAAGIMDLKWRSWSLNLNLSYLGKVYTTTTNSMSLDDYFLSDVGLGKRFLDDLLGIHLQVDNLFDQAYQSVAYRPMPGRNFLLNINFNI